MGQKTLNIFRYPPNRVFDKFKYIFGNLIIGASSSSYIPSIPSYSTYNFFPSSTSAISYTTPSEHVCKILTTSAFLKLTEGVRRTNIIYS